MILISAENDLGKIHLKFFYNNIFKITHYIKGIHNLVMSFARYTSNQIVVIAANFNSTKIDCYLNLKALNKYLQNN